ncbi:MAG: T9SS type A sorting domain-containing protein [Candidatus Kapabacteria bacterium]|nr:T9SS type A sorting domain-containing protein [Candidatus Kapabacteria bacterium]
MNSKILYFLLIGLLFWHTVAFSQCANQSNIYTFKYGNKTYEVVKELKSWSEAADCAVERGGYLAEINDENEQSAIYNGIIAAGISSTYVSVMDGGSIAYVWIGATDKQTEGSWLWDGNNDGIGINFWNGQGKAGTGNGEPVASNYNNWGKSNGTGEIMEPDDFNKNQDAAAIALAGWPASTTFLGVAGQWNDININNVLYFVIEYNSSVGVDEINNKNNIKIYPNPCNKILNVDTNRNLSGIKYQVYDCTGKLMITDTFENSNTINTIHLNSGIYCLRFNDGISPVELKFIRQ